LLDCGETIIKEPRITSKFVDHKRFYPVRIFWGQHGLRANNLRDKAATVDVTD
jgi:hypothetical protein